MHKLPPALAAAPAAAAAAAPAAAAAASRRREVENALLVQALCGRPAGVAARRQLARYAAGELSLEQAFAELYEPAGADF